MAGRLTLDQLIGVRIPVPQFLHPKRLLSNSLGISFYITYAVNRVFDTNGVSEGDRRESLFLTIWNGMIT